MHVLAINFKKIDAARAASIFLRANFAPLRLCVTLIFSLRRRRGKYFHAMTLRRKDYQDCKQPCNAP